MNPKSGRFGPKPSMGTTFRKQKRLELIARLENAAIPEAAAAAMLCISVPRLKYIKRSPDYVAARIKITHGLILNQENELDLIKHQRKEMLTQMLPPALLALANELQAPATTLAERKHKVDVARDLLDREGTFAKVSRTEVKPVDQFDFEKADAESASIIAAIRGVAAPSASEHTSDAVEANEKFSNSHTLSQTDQQKALAKLDEEAAMLELMPTDGQVN